jgi:hypothetical protein
MTLAEIRRHWELELSLREDKAGPDSAAALYAKGVLFGLRKAEQASEVTAQSTAGNGMSVQ